MNDQQATTTNATPQFPGNWRIAADYDPNQHLISLKGRDYLNVQNRLLWFIRDQRDFITRGLATTSYVIRTELVEHDREVGYAHFKTYVRDVLGNEATMYGSEAAKDFADYAEKASTKSLGRALLALGYGTAFAPEMDEGERVVDAPVERRRAPSAAPARPAVKPAVASATAASGATTTAPTSASDEPTATEQQMVSIRKLCTALGKPEPASPLSYADARQVISQLSTEYQRARRAS
jgi:hypothetical protein